MHQDRPRPLAGRIRALEAALALFLLCVLSLAPAQAQVFKIEALVPTPYSIQGTTAFARADEATQPQFRVTLTGGTGGQNYSVNVNVAPIANALGDSPIDGADYRANSVPGTITLQPGGTNTFTLRVYDDESFEQQPGNRTNPSTDEQLTLTLNNPGGGSRLANGGGEGSAAVNYGIIDNDARPRIRVRGVQTAVADRTEEARFVEGNAGATGRTFQVELIGPSGNAGFRNDGNTLVRTTSIEDITFDYDYQNGDGTDPTINRTPSQRAPGTATLGTDFQGSFNNNAANGGVGTPGLIAIGTSNTTIPFSIVGDTQDENNEAFIVRILNPANVSNPEGTRDFGVILDDDAPVVTISDATVTEGNLGSTTTAIFTVELSGISVQPIQITYQTANGTAIAGIQGPNTVSDYQFNGGTLTFAPGETQKTIQVTVNGDNITEGGANRVETFFLQLFPFGQAPFAPPTYDAVPNNLSVDNVTSLRTVPEAIQRGLTFVNNNTTSNTATGNILDDDTTSISIDDASVVEGDGTGQTTIQFRISLTTPSQNAITVTASTQPNTAIVNTQPAGSIPNGDFVATSQQVVIAAGATDATFQVPVSNDDLDELDETFFVNLTNPLLNGTSSAGVVIADNQATGTIIDNDGPQIAINAGTVAAATDSPIAEGNSGTTPYVFTVSLSAASPQTVTVNYRTVDGTAVSTGANPDFTAVPALPVQTLTFAPGETTKQITIPVNGDLIFEGNTGETFSVVLSSTTNAAPTPFARQTAVGTINNDDAIPAVSVGDARAVEGNSLAFPITLSNPSAFPITVRFSTGNTAPGGQNATPGADYTSVTNGVVTFGAANSNQAGVTSQTVNVATVNDTIIEGNETFTLDITNATSANGGSVTVADNQGIGTIVDNDVPSASINNVSVNESAADATGTTNATFTITLSQAAVQPITFNVATASGTATQGSDFDAPPTQVTIPTGGTSATINVPVRSDVIAEVNETFTVTITAAPVTGAAPDEIPPVTITSGTGVGTIIDNDTAGVTVTPSATPLVTTEAGGTATFTVVLTSQPTANVTIALSSTDTGEGTVAPSTLTFTPATYSTPQTVTVTGVDDNLADGSVSYTITTGAAQSSDPFYANFPVADVAAVNTDNETPRLTVSSNAIVVTEGGTTTGTVTRNTENNTTALTVNLVASNANITVPSTVTIPAGAASVNFTVTAPNNFSVDGTRSATVTASATGFTTSNALAFQVQDDDSASVTVTPTTLRTSEAGTSATFTVRLNSSPASNVQINFTSSDTGEVLVAPASVNFTTANFNVPQTITVTGVNDDIADGPQSVAVRGTTQSSDANYAGAAVPAVTVTNADDDTAAFVVTPTSGLITDETGRTAVFTVAPSTIPQAPVSIEISSSDTTEGTVSPSRLTFAAGDRNPQTVTVTGVDDAVADGNVAYQIILGAASSTDASYAGINPADVSVTNQDNDNASVVVSTRALTTTEAGGTDAFSVFLTSQPTNDVTITALSTDTTEGVTEPSTLVFNASNFSTPQTIIVRGQNDNLVDGSVQYGIRLGVASDDPGYASLALPTLQATNVDNDAARVVVTVPAAGIRVNESGTSATFTVALVGQPAANVVVPITLDKPREARLSTSGLNFTPENYATPKTVTVTGVDDLVADGNQPFTINLGPTRSNDPAFNALRPTSVRGVTYDNDRAGVTLAPTTLTLREGGRGSIRITLSSQPSAPVTLTLLSSDTSELTVPASVVLNASNYRAGVVVPVTAVLDRAVDGDQQATVRITSQISADRQYNAPRSAVTGARITVTDADVPSVRISQTELTLNENGGSAILRFALGARPASSLRVLVTSSNTAVGVVGPSSLIFTPENFNVAQSVTVRAVDNSTVQSTPATFNVTATASAPGNPYNGVSNSAAVTVLDDDDATSPEVTIDSPANGGTFQSVSAVTGTVTDNRGVARLTVEVARLGTSGAPAAYLQSNGAFSSTPTSRAVSFSADGAYSLALPTLAVGRYRITAQAFDQSNNTAQAVSTFTITDAPTTITITSPASGGAVNPASVVRGTVSTRSSLTALTVILRRNVTLVKKFVVRRTGTAASSTFLTDAIGSLPAGTYTIVATASDAQGNTVSATSTVLVDNTPPTAVAITTPRNNQVVDNLFEVRGTVADNGGGSGLDVVQLVIKRRTDDTFFNGRTFQRAATTVRAAISGNTWVYSLPSGLPADPDPLNAVYSLQAIALDRAGNGVSSTAINVLLSSNGSAGDGTSGTPVGSGNSAVVASVPASPFILSTSAANASQVTLTFNGPINAAKASDVASYEVSIGGALVKIEGARASGSTAILLLPEGEAGAGDAVSIAYDLRDAQGRLLRGKTSVTVR